MRTIVVAALLVLGCKDKPTPAQERPAHGSAHAGSAAPPAPIDWAACDAAVATAVASPLAVRPQLLIDGCHVCGDWAPILRWNTPATRGGPKHAAIEVALDGCKAFCTGDSKTKFLGTLDDSRGSESRMPWKQLALLCKERVSAVPDGRFVDAPYFALDRIARAVGSHGGDLATRVFELELPLPHVSVVGTGVVLPILETGVTANVSELQITVLGGTISIGKMPRAHLTKDGVKVDLGSDGYPGKTVTAAQLAEALTALAAGDKTKTVMLLAPGALPAKVLVPVIAAAAAVMPVYLAAHVKESPEGWHLAGTIPAVLEPGTGNGSVRVTHEMNVQQLAEQLAHPRKSNRVGISGP